MQETWVVSLCWEDSLEKGMATLSSIPVWRTPWSEESGGLQATGLQRVGLTQQIAFSFLEHLSSIDHSLLLGMIFFHLISRTL